jgi:hypothetical protein
MEPKVGLPGFISPQDSPQESLGTPRTGLGVAEADLSRESSPSAPSSGSGGTQWADGPAAADSEEPLLDPESGAPADEKPRRTGSSRTFSRAEREAVKATVGQAVQMGSTLAHVKLTQADTLERAMGIYLADDEDVDNVSEPASSLIARHSGGDLANPDVADGLSIVFAFANYLIKQIAKQLHAAQIRAGGSDEVLEQAMNEGQAA